MKHFGRQELARSGFEQWAPALGVATEVPPKPGVYVVSYAEEPRAFPTTSCGGRFKERDPAVSPAELEARWVHGAEIVYIGQSSNLRRRLRELARFGAGEPAAHWGGRLIWQLPNPSALAVAWKLTGDVDPRHQEAVLINLFIAAYGRPPFANLA